MEETIDLDVDVGRIQQELLRWYEENHREFPWRNTTDPYKILVSEVMSQQTQLSRVETAWKAFIDRWPSVNALANTEQAAVVQFWTEQKLGYNNRAKYLHTAAQQVVEDYNGEIPESPEELESLTGVGPYTANAVASFAFNNGNAAIDTNVRRVLYRAYSDPKQEEEPPYEVLANTLLPANNSREWNNAIMELGSEVCNKTPRCDRGPCPWRWWCTAYATGDFTAPDVPTQPSFEGSRRQFRGRVIRALGEHETIAIDKLGSIVRVDYTPEGEYGREWLQGLLDDLKEDELIEQKENIIQLK
ncbi:A/G-specific adenine glycosylase [Salinarchaeum sp. IM2453]|uniref:A/G-specific adenine glycosylase n=1 Tax=Salinarchaeum sp. IM2453 TaxID=2862870 RepID=UPI001C835FBB|nr:A/G-specific adenine glycosylase [Salinarchaeum sp. IM2453]QZA89185.1 A/G-specific adenine glycosylase [Salinarchaeum sp. IM2453]